MRTPAALERRGWKTFEDARRAMDRQADALVGKAVKTSAQTVGKAMKSTPGARRKARTLASA